MRKGVEKKRGLQKNLRFVFCEIMKPQPDPMRGASDVDLIDPMTTFEAGGKISNILHCEQFSVHMKQRQKSFEKI